MNDATDDPKVLSGLPPIRPREAVQRWRLVLEREVLDPDAAQRGQLAVWEASLAASGLPLAGLDAPRPKPRFAPAAPLAAAIPGEAELVDVWLVERLPVWRVREALGGSLPPGSRLVDVHDVWLGEPALPGRVVASVYRAELAPGAVDAAALAAAVTSLLAADSIPRERKKGEAVVAYDLRPFIEAVEVGRAGDHVAIRMTLRHDPEKGVGRPEECLAAIGEALGRALEPVALIRERLVLADPGPPPPPAPRRRTAAGAGRQRGG